MKKFEITYLSLQGEVRRKKLFAFNTKQAQGLLNALGEVKCILTIKITRYEN